METQGIGWDKCPMYKHAQECDDKSEKKFVPKETCELRWDIIKNGVKDFDKTNEKVYELEKKLIIVHDKLDGMAITLSHIEDEQSETDAKLEQIIKRNDKRDELIELTKIIKTRKEKARDAIVTAVITAFIIAVLFGGWELFKKVTIILENSQHISGIVVPKNIKLVPKLMHSIK